MVCEDLDAMVLPPIVYGYKSQGGGQKFPGTTSLDGTDGDIGYEIGFANQRDAGIFNT